MSLCCNTVSLVWYILFYSSAVKEGSYSISYPTPSPYSFESLLDSVLTEFVYAVSSSSAASSSMVVMARSLCTVGRSGGTFLQRPLHAMQSSMSASFIKNKTVKGKKTKKGIFIIEDKTIADFAKTATEKHIVKLIKQKSISRDEVKRMFKCTFCQVDGHFEVDCRKKKSASKVNSSDKDKLLKTRTPRYQSQCSSPSQVLQPQ